MFLIRNDTHFRLHSSLGENCYKKLFSQLLVILSWQTPHLLKNHMPSLGFAVPRIVSKKIRTLDPQFIGFLELGFFADARGSKCKLLSSQISFYPPHGKFLKSKTVTSISFWLLQVVLSASKSWKDDVFVRNFSGRGLPARMDGALVCENYPEVVASSFQKPNKPYSCWCFLIFFLVCSFGQIY